MTCQRRKCPVRLVWLLAALLLAVFCGHPALPVLGGSGGSVVFPMFGKKPKSGLQMAIHSQGIDATGYRPVRIEVSPLPAGKFTEDRQIRVVLKINEYHAGYHPEVSQVIDLPEGSTIAEAIVAVPQTSYFHQLNVETFEGGDRLPDLSQDYVGWPNNNYWQWSEALPAILVIDADVPTRAVRDNQIALYQATAVDNARTYLLPDVRTLAWVFPDPNRGYVNGAIAPGSSPAASGRLSDTELLAHIRQNMGRIEMLPPSELPTRWIDFSQFDVIGVSAEELNKLAKDSPKSLEAIGQWVRGGRVLLVWGAGKDFSRLAAIESRLGLTALPEADDDDAGHRAWWTPDPMKSRQELQTVWDSGLYGYGGTAFPSTNGLTLQPGTVQAAAEGSTGNTGANAIPFLSREAGLGTVVAIAAEDAFPGQESDWIWIFNSIPKNQWSWYQREGLSLHRLNDDYWNFLIVGAAPVISFLLLVSLFAIAIGPVNYVLLNRVRRLYLLLLTVPAAALIVTLGLFTYAVLTDGLGVRVRARSFVDLDQRSGHAAGWSRLSYFANITPSRGFVFPEDAAVFPLEFEPPNLTGQSRSQRQRLLWDGQQNLRSGYISARTSTQFMVERSTKTKLKLAVREGPLRSRPPEVENQLGTNVLFLLLRDSRGSYYSLANLESGSKSPLVKTSAAAAEKELAKLAAAVRPELPKGYDPSVHHNSALAWMMPDFRNRGTIDQGSAQPMIATSILERSLSAVFRPSRQPPQPGSYLAITASSVIVPSGLTEPAEESSLHVVRGRY